MKGGDVIIVEALRALHATGALRGRQVTVVFTGDEEDTGEPQTVSRAALLEAGAQSDVALAFEGAAPGVAVIGRRGIGSWRLQVSGEQAHSSGIFRENRGYGAIFEAARILDRFRVDLREPYLTFNPSVVVGGTRITYDDATKSGTALGKTNVIPREVQVEGDLRFLGTVQFETARRKMQEIVAASPPGTSAKLEVAASYPSMAPNPGSERVLGVLDAVSRDLGAGPIVAQPPGERGAGDIAFVCEDGRLACLDGLGSLGEQEHAPGEYIELDALPLQVKRAALLMYRLSRGWTLQ
jgi:glutamate carboxypeptidase